MITSSSKYVFLYVFFFFFNDTATTEIYTLSLHDALPIYPHARGAVAGSAHPVVDHACSSLAGPTSWGRVHRPGPPAGCRSDVRSLSGDLSSSLRPEPAPPTGVPRRCSARPAATLIDYGGQRHPLSPSGGRAEPTKCRVTVCLTHGGLGHRPPCSRTAFSGSHRAEEDEWPTSAACPPPSPRSGTGSCTAPAAGRARLSSSTRTASVVRPGPVARRPPRRSAPAAPSSSPA